MTKPLAPIVVEILFCFDFTLFRMTKCGAKKIATDSGIKLLKKLCQRFETLTKYILK